MDRLQGDAEAVAGIGRSPGLDGDAADIAADLGGKRGAPAAVVPLIDIHLACGREVAGRAGDDVGVAVAVHIARRCHYAAKAVPEILTDVDRIEGGRTQAHR